MRLLVVSLLLATMVSCQRPASLGLWDTPHLAEVKSQLSTSAYYGEAYNQLVSRADSILALAPLSVMYKESVAPSGDRHDYLSQARYFWPNPATEDGLPYVNRDGETNPEIYRLDRYPLSLTAERIKTLALAYYLSDDQRYGDKAAELVDAWFLNPATRMNPHLEYAQMVPGQNNGKGRCYGLIDAYSLVEMLQALQLAQTSSMLPTEQDKALRQWIGQLAKWMIESPQGQEESMMANNHSMAYDAELAALLLYSGEKSQALEVLGRIDERILAQIDDNGHQPMELGRTLAYHYSQYNLGFVMDLMAMAREQGISLSEEAQRRVSEALRYLAQYVGHPAQWPYQQIDGWEKAEQTLLRHYYRAGRYLGLNDDYNEVYLGGRRLDLSDPFHLIYYQASTADDALVKAAYQLDHAYRLALPSLGEERSIPRSINTDGSLHKVDAGDWCAGFFAGELWQMYRYTHDPLWAERASLFTWPLEKAKHQRGTHDLGFVVNDSFGLGYELTGDTLYRDVVVEASHTLAERFNPEVGCIRSWDFNRDRWTYPVIIDNMMNLEMLYQATRHSGDSLFAQIADRHAMTTMAHHFRADKSSYHVVDYDPTTGDVRWQGTFQGATDDSYWSRGQAWGLYGYTMCYRFNPLPQYLEQAQGIASFIMSYDNLPSDSIYYWDMKAPSLLAGDTASTPRDASSAAITASALYELARYVEPTEAEQYVSYADGLLHALESDTYTSPRGDNHGFILLHSTGHHPGGSEIDTPINYADYYYLEALNRRASLPPPLSR
ncbi:MAG: alginate lyase family protein [Bacteroidales bacterium]|nr:alginate lyase family protein [Bacteroidales bacterium]